MSQYVELQCTSHYSFLRGASSCEDLFIQAGVLGMSALAITDRNSLAGIVRAHQAAKVTGVRLIVGCRLVLTDESQILVYPTNRQAYSRLCRLLSLGKKRGVKKECELNWSDVGEYAEGLIAILVPDEVNEACAEQLASMSKCFGKNANLSLTLRRRPRDAMRLYQLAQLAVKHHIPTVITNDVLYHAPETRILQDVVTCVRLKCTIDNLGFDRELHADRHLITPEEMHRVYRNYPAALARTIAIASRCKFSLDELAYQYPKEVVMPGFTPQQALEKLTWEGAAKRFPEGVPLPVQKQLWHELTLIANLQYAPYFLTVDSIVRFARSQDILCQGRGSAANSAVCYVLGITSIDPCRHNLLFERFVSQERNEPPDIDVDFEHERREEVIQWIYETYGRHRAALCSTVARYRAKGALRDVGKVMGLPVDMLKGISSQLWTWSEEGAQAKHAEELNLNLNDRRLRMTLVIAQQLMGAPRHFSQHPGGFVLTNDRLDEMVPIAPAAMQDRQIIEWDKDDIDIVKFMKVDCLALGMLTCMKRGLNFLKEFKNVDMELATIPAEDSATYDMICEADTLGTFQIESRAQMNSLPRTLPRTYYDLVVQVALVRPGPIQGDMVHPYLRRRNGLEPVEYPTPELKRVLGKTLGVPLFQEQAMQVAIECAGFTPGEADQFRRAMATFKFTGGVTNFRDKLVNGMIARGYAPEFAMRIFSQLEGFGSYGFPESHAASFAIVAYCSSWLKCHHPDIFCAALLNSQPMGFYAPAQIVMDARRHGVEVLPICANKSRWDCTLEPSNKGYYAVRLGLRLVNGLAEKDASSLVIVRANERYANINDIWQRGRIPVSALNHLAEADAFLETFKLSRRQALWEIKALRDELLPLFVAASEREYNIYQEIIEAPVYLRPMTEGHEVVEDYSHIGLSLRNHPVSFLRPSLAARKIKSCNKVNNTKDRSWTHTAGLVLVRQKPGSAKGVLFITIEDETGTCNVVVWPSLFEKQRRLIFSAGLISVEGQVQREGKVVHLIANKLYDLSEDLASIGDNGSALTVPFANADETFDPSLDHRLMPKPRDIYIPDIHIDTIKVKTRDFR